MCLSSFLVKYGLSQRIWKDKVKPTEMLSSSCDILQYMVADGLLSADCPRAALSADGYHFPEPLVVNAFLSALLDRLIWSPRGSLVLAEAGKGLCHWCRCLTATAVARADASCVWACRVQPRIAK